MYEAAFKTTLIGTGIVVLLGLSLVVTHTSGVGNLIALLSMPLLWVLWIITTILGDNSNFKKNILLWVAVYCAALIKLYDLNTIPPSPTDGAEIAYLITFSPQVLVAALFTGSTFDYIDKFYDFFTGSGISKIYLDIIVFSIVNFFTSMAILGISLLIKNKITKDRSNVDSNLA